MGGSERPTFVGEGAKEAEDFFLDILEANTLKPTLKSGNSKSQTRTPDIARQLQSHQSSITNQAWREAMGLKRMVSNPQLITLYPEPKTPNHKP